MALSLLLWGCTDTAPFFRTADEDEGEIAITLRVPVEGADAPTRGLPTGGEEGDGREAGINKENSLADANIFFFKGSGFNPTDVAPESIEVTGVYVADIAAFTAETDDDPFEKKITIKIKSSDTPLEEKGILTASEVGFITVINAGRDLSTEIANLKVLREYSSFTSSWRESEEGCCDFLMTTAYDANAAGNVTIGATTRFVGSNRLEKNRNGNGDPRIEWTGETTVQRICARIDLMYKDNNIGEGELVYTTPARNKVHITNILPVNFMSKPSYLLAKTTSVIPTSWNETALGEITWGGTEKTATGSDRPANYVIDPFTITKASGTRSLTAWYGSSAASTVKQELKDAAKGTFPSYYSTTLPSPESNGCDRITIIGYANENIQAPTCYTSELITGLALRANFQPYKIWIKEGDNYEPKTLTDEGWKEMEDKTIWRYQPSAGTEGVKEEDAFYFISEEDALAYKASHPYELGDVTKYENGICYYNLWLRHYNDESYKEEDSAPKEIYPMEFAIVRNNIYRVGMSFSGSGEPTPTLREPDTMMSRIFVRKWNQRKETTPLQF